jgi:hypothetical protein
MCGGREDMIAKTGKQLAGTKRNGRRKPVTEATKTRAKKSADAAAAAAVTKAGRTVGQKTGAKKVSVKKSGSQKPTVAEIATAEPENSATFSIDASSGTETPEVESAKNAVDADVDEIGSDGTDKAAGNGTNGAANSKGNGEPVKTLTEAGKKRLVNKLLGLADSQATQGAFKITPADLIRLMQLHREMNPQKDRKVTVQWIEDKPE